MLNNKIEDLYKNDCLEILKNIKNESIDLIVTDPPYVIGYEKGRDDVLYDNQKIENELNIKWISPVIKELYRILKTNSGGYLFSSFKSVDLFKKELEKYFKIENILIWKKNNFSFPNKNKFNYIYEIIYFISKGDIKINYKSDHDVLEFRKVQKLSHVTEKPIYLLEYLIGSLGRPGDVVIDPFMGSGSTGVSAKRLNRGFIGIEINDHYFEIAEKRIKNNFQMKFI